MKAIVVLFIALGVLYANAATCESRIEAAARAGSSWTENGVAYRVWDITVTNTGTCALNRIVGFFSPAGGFISSAWNYDTSSGVITGYGPSLAAGASFTSAGFILANASSPTLAFNRPGCESSCTGTQAPTTAPTGAPTGAPTTAPTSAPTSTPTGTRAPTTAAPTATPTGTRAPTTAAPTTAAPVNCSVDIVIRKDDYYWITDGKNNSIYRITITNTGRCPLIAYVTSFAFFPGTLEQRWNLESTLGGYLVTGYGPSLAPGASYSGAGIIVSNAPNGVVTPTPYGSACTPCA